MNPTLAHTTHTAGTTGQVASTPYINPPLLASSHPATSRALSYKLQHTPHFSSSPLLCFFFEDETVREEEEEEEENQE